MTIQVVCECGFNKQVPDEWRGKKVKCKCGRAFVVGETLANSPAVEESETASPPKAAATAKSKPGQPKAPQSAATPPKPVTTKPRPSGQTAKPADEQLDLNELVAGELPTEPSPIMQAIDEFDEVAVTGKGKLDMLDLFEELDMREGATDELDMSESPQPAAPIPPAPAAAAPAAPAAPKMATPKPKAAAKPAAPTPVAMPPAAARPAAAAPQQPAATKPKPKPAPPVPSKPVNPAQLAPATPSSAEPKMVELEMAEPISQQTNVVPSAPQTQNFTAGAAHVTGAIHIDAPGAAPAPVVQGAPRISVSRLDAATPAATTLALRQKAKRKSDMIKMIILGIASFLTLLIFGCIFGLGALLHKFDDPKKKAKEEAEKIEQVDTSEITPEIVEEQPTEPAKTDDTKADDTKTEDKKPEGETTPKPAP